MHWSEEAADDPSRPTGTCAVDARRGPGATTGASSQPFAPAKRATSGSRLAVGVERCHRGHDRPRGRIARRDGTPTGRSLGRSSTSKPWSLGHAPVSAPTATPRDGATKTPGVREFPCRSWPGPGAGQGSHRKRRQGNLGGSPADTRQAVLRPTSQVRSSPLAGQGRPLVTSPGRAVPLAPWTTYVWSRNANRQVTETGLS